MTQILFCTQANTGMSGMHCCSSLSWLWEVAPIKFVSLKLHFLLSVKSTHFHLWTESFESVVLVSAVLPSGSKKITYFVRFFFRHLLRFWE